MKLKITIITMLLLIGANSAHAQLFGWSGSVTFTDGVSNLVITFSGPSYYDCEAQRAFTKTIYSPPTYSVVSETPCISLYFDPNLIFIIPEIEIPLPDPGCKSCPYLREDIVKLIYPHDYTKVVQMMDKFRINEYNEALQELNSQFDLEGFGQEMFFLEKEISRNMRR